MPAQKRITVSFQTSEQFRRYHANGVFGGISPGGELEMYITEDIVPVPSTIDVHGTIKEGASSEQIKGGKPTRLVHASVTIPLHIVPSIIAWLNSKVAQAEKIGILTHDHDITEATAQAAATKGELPQ